MTALASFAQLACAAAGIAAMGSAWAMSTVPVDFAAGTQKHWNNLTTVTVNAAHPNAFVVTRVPDTEKKYETAWDVISAQLPLPSGAMGYAVTLEISAMRDFINCETSDAWGSAVLFYDKAGKRIHKRPIDLEFHKNECARFRYCGEIPSEAAAVALEVGTDGPNLPMKEKVEVRNAAFAFYGKGERLPNEIVRDVLPPHILSRFEAPTADANLTVRYEVVDASPIDWTSVVVSNVADRCAIPFSRDGNVMTLRPASSWTKGRNRLTISVRDTCGNACLSRKSFLIGEPPKNTPRITLRDDGVTLIDGKPFFPIGIYSVKRTQFNHWDFDRACADLKAAGFNTLQSYEAFRDPEFHAALRRHGMYSFTADWHDEKSETWLMNGGRENGDILSWYIGDDTSMKVKLADFVDRYEAARMLDGTRIICHADGIHGGARKSNYQDYVPFADVFLPELYHIYAKDRANDSAVVSYVIRDMDRVVADNAKFSPNQPRGIWPILQTFHGRSWSRYPDPDEIEAMSFAALIHGGTGITWFHYAGELDVANGHRYSGCFRTQKDWCAFTNMTTRIAALAPVLLERTPAQPQKPEIVSGQETDASGRTSVSVLVKKHRGATYVLAVNAASKPVRARIFASVSDGAGEVLWENRKVHVADGAFEDDFKGLGVHVYRYER